MIIQYDFLIFSRPTSCPQNRLPVRTTNFRIIYSPTNHNTPCLFLDNKRGRVCLSFSSSCVAKFYFILLLQLSKNDIRKRLKLRVFSPYFTLIQRTNNKFNIGTRNGKGRVYFIFE